MASPLTRRGALCVALVLMLAGGGACKASRQAGVGTSGTDTTSTSAGAASDPTTPQARGRGAGTTTPGSNGPGPSNAVVVDAANGQPGAFAGILLGQQGATSIVVDLLVQAGASPSSDALSRVLKTLGDASGKQVSVTGPSALASSAQVHTAAEIRAAADDQGRASQTAAHAVVHLLYFAGSYTDQNALGVTVRGDTIAVFPNQIDNATTPLVGRSRLERAVVTHEVGHVMGLVDLFLNDNRSDPDHRGHSTNPNSVMYWAVETDLVSQVLDGPPPTDFDTTDQSDLARIRGGAPSQV